MGVFDHIVRLRDVSDLDVAYALLSPQTLGAFFLRAGGLVVDFGDLPAVLDLVRAYTHMADEDTWTSDLRWATLTLSQPRGTLLTLQDGPTRVGALRLALPFPRVAKAIAAEPWLTAHLVYSTTATSITLAAGLPDSMRCPMTPHSRPTPVR